MPRVSVVIPNYQGENFIKPCLSSLLLQEQKDMVIRIIDNGSSDQSVGRIQDFLEECGYLEEKGCTEEAETADTDNTEPEQIQGKWTRYLSGLWNRPPIELLLLRENTGFCHAVNAGIQRSKEEYLFLLNNDTTLDAPCIRELVSFMDVHREAFSAGAKLVTMQDPSVVDDCGDYLNALGYAYAAGKGKNSNRYEMTRRVFSACAGAAIYRRNVFDRVGLFDENHFAYLEDVDIGYRARIFGYRNYVVPSALVFHAGSAVSGSRHNAFKVSLSSKNSIYLVYKNQLFLQWILNLPFLLAGYLVKFLYFTRKGLGITYIRGLGKGITFCFSKEARAHKVRFRIKNLPHYIKIQLELWMNIVRMFTI